MGCICKICYLNNFFRPACSQLFKFLHLESSKESLNNNFLEQDLSQFSCSYKSCLTHFNLTPENKRLYLWCSDIARLCKNRILAWNGFSSVMIKMLFLPFSFLSCKRSMWDRILFSKDWFIHNWKTVTWYDSGFLQFLFGFIMVESSPCLSNG